MQFLNSGAYGLLLSACALVSATPTFPRTTATCNNATLDNSTYEYPITKANTTVFQVANATGRGVCDIGRENLMADVTIIPNVGQSLVIPPQTCEPDNESCLLPGPGTRECLLGGPRLYYTVNGDTFTKIATRLNISVDAVTTNTGNGGDYGADDLLPVGEFVKIPLCEPSRCEIQPMSFTSGVYKDWADKYGSTVGQIMMLSPTYNYSTSLLSGGLTPPINVPINCQLLDSNYTVLS